MQCPVCCEDTLKTTNSYPPQRGSPPALIAIRRLVCPKCKRTFTGLLSAVMTDPGPKGLSRLPWIPELADARVQERPAGSGKWRIVNPRGKPLLHPKTQRPIDDGGRSERLEAEFLLATFRMANPRPVLD